MGRRGLMGLRRKLQKIKRLLVRETGWVLAVQRMGLEPRPRARRHEGQTRRRRSRQNPIHATAANVAGLPGGAAIARRQHLRREATVPIDFSRRGTIRAVFRRERINLM